MSALEPYIAAWRERWRREALERERLAEGARMVAKEVALLLRERFQARRIVLIGSLARGEFQPDSDIDLVVEGIAPDKFFRAGAEAERAAGGIDVDLVPLESASPALLDQVVREGVELP